MSTYNEHTWVPKGAATPIPPRQTTSSRKRILTIFWSPLGFAMVEILPKGIPFNATYFCSEVFSEIDQNRPRPAAEDQ
jgi:hypothetical protein